MIAFGCTIGEPEPYRRYAEPGIRRAAEPDSAIYAFSSVGTLGRSYNLLLEAAGRRDDLEALVLVRPHAELADPDLCAKVRAALSDERVAVVGSAGATGVTSIAWWDGTLHRGHVEHAYSEEGGGEMPAYFWAAAAPPPAEVETVDPFLLVLSPWAVRELRFDEALIYGHGFELDFCLRARQRGRKVMVADVGLIEHRPLELVSDLELWVEGHIQFARKWEGQLAGAPVFSDWRERARRAEAECEAARAIAYSRRLAIDARIATLERELERTTNSLSWRVTQPLRELNQWRRERAAHRNGRVPAAQRAARGRLKAPRRSAEPRG